MDSSWQNRKIPQVFPHNTLETISFPLASNLGFQRDNFTLSFLKVLGFFHLPFQNFENSPLNYPNGFLTSVTTRKERLVIFHNYFIPQLLIYPLFTKGTFKAPRFWPRFGWQLDLNIQGFHFTVQLVRLFLLTCFWTINIKTFHLRLGYLYHNFLLSIGTHQLWDNPIYN